MQNLPLKMWLTISHLFWCWNVHIIVVCDELSGLKKGIKNLSSSEIEMIAQSSRDRMMMDLAKKFQRMFFAKSVENHIWSRYYICQNLEFGALFYWCDITYWSNDNELVGMVHWYFRPGVKTFLYAKHQKTLLSKSRYQ